MEVYFLKINSLRDYELQEIKEGNWGRKNENEWAKE